MPDPIIVTLDGPAGVGKTTLAKRVAQAMGIAYLDTGAMFRTVALGLGEGGWEWGEDELGTVLAGLRFGLSGSGEDSVLSVGGRALGDDIRTEQVGMWASNLAKIGAVREALKKAQRKIGENTSLVAEGRDMGTVVFPRAAHKFFLDADPAERARRRYRQLEEMGKPADLAEIEAGIRARDEQDRNRAVAPLKPAEDAAIVDTTKLDVDGVFARLMDEIRAKG